MVIPDLSSHSNDFSVEKEKLLPLATVSDRFLSFVIDFLIFSPIVTLLISGFLKEIRTYMILDSNSPEASVVWSLMIVSVFFLSVVMQSTFLYYFNGTPGQIFLKISVQTYPQRRDIKKGELSYSQCVQRSAFWWASWLLLGLPFFEVASHPNRRTLYERVSDTITLTMSKTFDHGPTDVESHFISNWIKLCYVAGLAVFALYFVKVREQIRMGYFSRNEQIEDGRLCSEIPDSKKGALERLDTALAMYLSDSLAPECLESEANFVLWKRDPEGKDLANLAKSLVVEDEDRADEYLHQACRQDSQSEVCSLALFLQSNEEDKGTELRRRGLKLLSSRIMLLHEMMNQKNNLAAVALIQDLSEEKELESHLQKLYVKTVWNINDNKVKNPRSPASAEFEQIVQDFKAKFGIP